ncbi:MAG: HD-GYP domain-containing protein [Lachnospiraceae bacterium]|nr:HD-GYP domain-containing protein [Lachnospiraceae bacterium]
MKQDKKKEFRYGIVILALTLFVQLAGLGYLELKVSHDLSNPFTIHLSAGVAKDSADNVNDGSIGSEDSFLYTVDISKHWLNDPDTPLQTYGAQYDNTIANDSSYDIVDWKVVMEVPERNITVDSYWNGEWVYDKQVSTIDMQPTEIISTIKAGDSVTFGAVLISKELMDFTDLTFTGCRYKPITKYPLFWLIMICLVAWVTSTIAYVLYRFRDENYRKNAERLNSVISQTMSTFANFIDTKDAYTKGHSARVSYYSMKLAEKLGIGEEEVKDIGYIGLMHDCGKLGIPESILNKPGRLTPEEFDVMKEHTTNGFKILKDFTAIKGIRDGVLYHHERYDGDGYMEGLAGENIPLVARIICVADALDAMNSDRCYRTHLSKDVIISELETNKGTQFDPVIAQYAIDMINSGEIFIEG